MTHSPAFRTGLSTIARGDILVPPLRAYLSNPDFRGFTIQVRGLGRRAPDGLFHPSEHPSWPLKALWLYLVAPSNLVVEPPDPTGVLAMTAGSIWHAIIERSLLDLDLLVTNELRFTDPATRSVGNADGLVKPPLGQEHPSELFEFKTYNPRKMAKTDSVEDFIEKNPGYHLQAMEYMRMSGYRKMRFLLMSLMFPFEMKEFVIEYDMAVGEATASKYRQAIQDAADGHVPMCDGCGIKSECPARAVCASVSDDQIKRWIRG